MHHNTENYFQISYEIFIRTVVDRNGTIFFIIFGIKFHNYLFIYLVEQILSLYVMSCTSSESALWLTLYQGTHCLKQAQYLEFNDCNRILINSNKLVCKWILSHLAKLAWNDWVFISWLSGCGFESCSSHFYFYTSTSVCPEISGEWKLSNLHKII